MLSYMYEIVMCVDTILMAMTFCSVTLENDFFSTIMRMPYLRRHDSVLELHEIPITALAAALAFFNVPENVKPIVG